MTPSALPMTEDDLQQGITDALTLAGWYWFHIRRSDLAVVQGAQGWPDVFAVHPTRRITLILELKSDSGQLTAEQAGWFASLSRAGHNPIVIRPCDYDRIVAVILDRPLPLA